MRNAHKLLLLGLLLFSLSQTGLAQQTTGTIEGRLIDADGNAVAGANILVAGESLQGTRGAASAQNGHFRLVALPVGKYEVNISHIAYHEATAQAVAVRLGRTTTLGEVTLQPKTIEMSGVIVTATTPAIDPTTHANGLNIDSATFENIPTERDYRSILTLVPQANASFLGDGVNISGSTGLENVFYIDGINVTDPNTGSTSTQLPFNFIKEVQVKTGGYEAEYGRAQGGIINVITHSGSNEFHGSAFGFFTNNRFAGDPKRGFVDFEMDNFTQWDGGFSLSGPIVKDQIWFYGAYNHTVEQEDLRLLDFGFFEDKRTADIFAGKLTWKPAPNSSVVFTILGDPTEHRQVANPAPFFGNPTGLQNIDPFLALRKEGGVSVSLSGTFLISDNFLLESAISRLQQNNDTDGVTERGRREPILVDNISGIWAGGSILTIDDSNRRSAGRLSGTFFIGDHRLKAGFEYEDNKLETFQTAKKPGAIIVAPGNIFQAIYIERDFEVHNRVPTVFAQDSWQVIKRLRVNLGLRWDGNYLVGTDGKVAQSITDQYQPRVGFTYEPGEIGTQKIYGSFGRFYEQIPTGLPSSVHSEWLNGVIIFNENPLTTPSVGDTTLVLDFAVEDEIEDLEGQYYDEFSLGYERQISNYKVGIRGVFRTLRQAIDGGIKRNESGQNIARIGNPGKGNLDFLPEFERDYYALELTLQKFAGRHFNYTASYVLSRTEGNYPGLFDSDTRIANVNGNNIMDLEVQAPNSNGLLPNDRTHIFKFFGSYNFDAGVTLGTSFFWQSGTPLNEFGDAGFFTRRVFLRERGTNGRTPSLWDLNIRATYDLNRAFRSRFPTKLYLDILHLGSQRKALDFDQDHFFTRDPETGEQTNENPTYLQPLSFQPPMTVRLGMEVGF